ncbi:FKBP12-associated protein 1-like protein [Colletotrichum orbiculare MAFF 240422]|uniref:FKBP12-associated protein 1-like protein n=1 Tax=Colletotrichum orbiculare (strain 104-T / ATCC 96160 / CBS 514.97 / LARS 414 / MAFF 240422) TaxID=1213857 RepID=A0A484G302_COLOR|nr:FKBP12-associated protein 1-like protein [Colletotrichum orbiculare MAFF 240422]
MQLSPSVPLFIAFGLASAANRCEMNGWYNGPFGNNRQLNAPSDPGASASYVWNGNTIVVKMQTKIDRCPPEDPCRDDITYNFKNTGTARIRVRIEEQVNKQVELILPPGVDLLHPTKKSGLAGLTNAGSTPGPPESPPKEPRLMLKRRRLEEEALIPVGEVDLGVDEEIEGVVNEADEAANQNQDRVSAAPEPAAPPAASANASEAAPSGSSRRGRGRGGSRGGRRGGGTRGGQVSGTQRTFGGHLTTNVTGGESSASLSADAPDFVPGQPIAQKSAPAPKQRKPQYPTAPKSTANDLPTRIHEDISHGQYECVICSSEVLRPSRVWSCTVCWTVLHLSCVKKWYTSQLKKDDDTHSWRCPGCNSNLTEEPTTYHCWCGKDINPRNVPGLPPHSCGQTCSKPRSTCPHPCSLECHAGPCPPCSLMGPTQACFCGKHEVTKRCTETDYGSGWSCKEVCGDMLPCVEKACLCGKQRIKNRPCWLEEARCGLPCGKKLKCGTHTCRKECHRPGECEDADIAGHHCAQSCGKIRKSCEHSCQDVCHAPYPCKEDRPCQSKTFITCDCQHRKKEVKCLATLANPTPERDTLKCDDECLRLQRNQRLAAALNVDPDHSDDHIPYSDKTLQLFRGVSPTWAQNQEREFRVFASEPSEKRLRFKPMPSKQRAFLHSLAEDFGFDSESQDPEPHRHVSIFKTPRFVSAPKKTIAQCVKIRTDAAKAAAPPAPSSSAAATAVPDPFNSILLTAPRFGLTIDEVDSALAPHLTAHNNLSFATSFLPSDEILLRAVPVTSWGTSPSAVESSLTSLRTLVHRTVTKEGFAATAILVTSDANLNVLRREGATAGGSGGWNAVVGRAAAQRRTLAPAKPEARPASGFVSFSKLARKKIVEDSVADDWEAAADGEE